MSILCEVIALFSLHKYEPMGATNEVALIHKNHIGISAILTS